MNLWARHAGSIPESGCRASGARLAATVAMHVTECTKIWNQS